MGLAVVVNLGAILRHRHRRVDLVNLQLAVHHRERHCREVRVIVAELALRKTHRVGARVGLRHARRAREHDLARIEQARGARLLRRVAARRVRLTVIRRFHLRARNLHRHRGRRDLHVSIRNRKCHRSEIVAGVREQRRHQTHIRGARVRARGRGRAAEREVGLRVCGIVNRDIVTAHTVRLAVVGLGVMMTRNGHHRVHLLDHQPTIGHMERHNIVGVDVHELSDRKAHVRGTRIRAHHDTVAAEREIILRVLAVLRRNRHGITMHAVLIAVIILGIVLTDNRHNHRTGLHHLHPTVVDGERHMEVGIRIRELAGIQAHIRSTGIGLRGRSRAAEGNVALIIQNIVNDHRVARHRVGTMVILHHVSVTRHRHTHLNGRDGLITVGHVERHGGEVGIRIGELLGIQSHHHSAGIGLRGRCRAAEREVGLRVETRRGRHRVACHRVRLSVIGTAVAVTRDGHHRVDRIHGLVTVRHMERDHAVKITVDILEHGGRETHVHGAGIGERSFRRAAEREVVLRISGIADRHVIATHAVDRSVVVRRVLVSRDGHHHRAGFHNLKPAIRHAERHIEVRIVISELTG